MRLTAVPLSLAAIACLSSAAHSQATPPAATAPGAPATAPAAGAPETATPAAVDPEKAKLIHQLLEVTGTASLMKESFDRMIGSFKDAIPDAPAGFWDKFQAKMHPSDLIEQIIPIYAKYYSKEDVQGLITFYGTPLGKRVLATLPQISAESMKVGQAWGQRMAEQVQSDMKAAKSAPQPTAKPTKPPTQ